MDISAYTLPPKKSRSLGERAYWLGEIEKLAQVSRQCLIFKHLKHVLSVKDPAGKEILKDIYLDAMKADRRDGEEDVDLWRRVRLWKNIKESRV